MAQIVSGSAYEHAEAMMEEVDGGAVFETMRGPARQALSVKEAEELFGAPVEALKDAYMIGDWDSDTVKKALDRETKILWAVGAETPGKKWQMLEGDVGSMLARELSTHPVGKKDGPGAVYAEGIRTSAHTSSRGGVTNTVQYYMRNKVGITAITALAIDVDKVGKIRDVVKRLLELGWLALCYTTHSHAAKQTEACDRFRVILFLKEPFTFEALGKSPTKAMMKARAEREKEWQRIYAGVIETLGLEEIDASAVRINQLMYLPRRASEDAVFEHYLIAGELLDTDKVKKGDPAALHIGVSGGGQFKEISEKDYEGQSRPMLSDRFDLLDWHYDGGRYIMVSVVLQMVGWETGVESYSGWWEILCPNAAQHSDGHDTAGVLEGEEGFGFNCFHAHCSDLKSLDFLVLIEQAILDGEAVLPDEYATFSALLCDHDLFPEIDGATFEGEVDDYREPPEVAVTWLKNARDVQRAFDTIAGDSTATEANFAALYAGVGLAGYKAKAAERLDALMKGVERFDANKRKSLAASGKKLLEQHKKEFAAKKAAEEAAKLEEAVATTEPANTSLDPADPLGDSMEEALATLRHRYIPTNIGGKFRVVRKPDMSVLGSAMNSTIEVFTETDFKAFHKNRSITLNDGGIVYPADKFMETTQRASGIVFAPPPANAGHNYYNTYFGRTLTAQEGEWPTLQEFIFNVACNGDQAKYDWLILWMAHMVQFPGEKPGTAVIAHGSGGIGKGTMGQLLMNLTAPHAMQIENDEHVTGRFAGEHLSKCILVVVNEALFGKSGKVSSQLKALIDSKSHPVEAKGMNVTTAASYSRYYIDSNSAVAVLIENNGSERRYFVVKFSDARQGNKAYFERVYAAMEGDEMKALLRYLEEYVPASAGFSWNDVRTAPATPERAVMGEHSMSSSMAALSEVLKDGEVTLPGPEGPVTFTMGAEGPGTGLRVPRSAFRKYIAAAGKDHSEDRDVPGMFACLFPSLKLGEGQGRVGTEENHRWWEFPLESLGEAPDQPEKKFGLVLHGGARLGGVSAQKTLH